MLLHPLHPTAAIRLTLVIIMILACSVGEAQKSNWPQWRGPNFNGSSPAVNLPTAWSKESALWKTPLPGPAGCTPVLWENHVFLTSLDNETQELKGYCVDRKSGAVVWEQVMGMGHANDNRGRNMSDPSPVTDGERVIFLFGSTDLVCLDFSGKVLWQKNLAEEYGDFNILFGYHCSPLLYKGTLYVQVLQRDHPIDGPEDEDAAKAESFLLAMNPTDGKVLWRHTRPTDAVEESHESYATPLPFEHGGRTEILLFGGDCVSGHDASTGKEFWRWGSWNPTKITHWRVVPTPVTTGNQIVVCPPKGCPIYAIKAGGNGALDDSAIDWKLESNTSDVCVPLYYKDRLYALDGDKKYLTAIDPKTGKVIWDHRFDVRGIFRTSPTGAEDKIYLINEEGVVFVLAAGDAYKEIARVEMKEKPCHSSIALADSQIFIRTGENLYCIGKGE